MIWKSIELYTTFPSCSLFIHQLWDDKNYVQYRTKVTGFVVSRDCLSKVCLVWSGLSRVCLSMVCLSRVCLSRVCRVQGLSVQGLFVQCLSVQGLSWPRVCLSRVCLSRVCLSRILSVCRWDLLMKNLDCWIGEALHYRATQFYINSSLGGKHQKFSFKVLVFVFKGTVSRDFRPLVFFTNQPHLGPWFTD
jgi:hypothetical protein